MYLNDVQNGIDACLINGKRLYDDAELLCKNNRFHTSIPIYILAYEELAKAKFLSTKYLNGQDIEESEFVKLTRSREAHHEKIKVDALDFRNMLETENDEM